MVRELRYRIPGRHSRTREVTLVTTLLDAELYPAEDLAQLYAQRWRIETNLRHLKQTMRMDVLRCETVSEVLKELTVFSLVYNLVRAIMHEASRRQEVAVERISFADALGWFRHNKPGAKLRALKVNSKTDMFVNVTIGVQQPDKVDLEKVRLSLPHGIVTVKVVKGGLDVLDPENNDPAVIASAAVEVKLELP